MVDGQKIIMGKKRVRGTSRGGGKNLTQRSATTWIWTSDDDQVTRYKTSLQIGNILRRLSRLIMQYWWGELTCYRTTIRGSSSQGLFLRSCWNRWSNQQFRTTIGRELNDFQCKKEKQKQILNTQQVCSVDYDDAASKDMLSTLGVKWTLTHWEARKGQL